MPRRGNRDARLPDPRAHDVRRGVRGEPGRRHRRRGGPDLHLARGRDPRGPGRRRPAVLRRVRRDRRGNWEGVTILSRFATTPRWPNGSGVGRRRRAPARGGPGAAPGHGAPSGPSRPATTRRSRPGTGSRSRPSRMRRALEAAGADLAERYRSAGEAPPSHRRGLLGRTARLAGPGRTVGRRQGVLEDYAIWPTGSLRSTRRRSTSDGSSRARR